MEELGFDPATHDEADALKFLLYYLDKNGIRYQTSQ